MSATSVGLGVLTIPSGQTNSGALGFNKLRFLDSITIHAPATLPEAVHVEVTYEDDRNTTVSTWTDLLSGGSGITIPAGDAVTISPVGVAGLRLVAGGAVAADRDFYITGSE